VEADRPCTRDLDEGLGEEVLAVVLLAVVAPAVPVHTSMDGPLRERAIEDVEDVALLLEDLEDTGLAQGPGVPGLAAALGVEGRAVEDRDGAAVELAAGENLCLEVEGVGVVQVETLGHIMPGHSAGASQRNRAVCVRRLARSGRMAPDPLTWHPRPDRVI